MLDAEALERVLVDALDPQPGATLTDEPDWVQLRTPSSRLANDNRVVVARLSEDEVTVRVRAVAEDHAARGASYRWVVGPSSAPASLHDAVQSVGLRRLGGGAGMQLDVEEGLAASDAGPKPLRIHPLDPTRIEAFASLTAAGWERGSAFESACRVLTARDVGDATRGRLHWVATWNDEPVATATLKLLRGVGYFQGGAVLPAYRRRGIYRALLTHRLRALRDHGIPTAVVWADEATSAPSCARAGFHRTCRADWYESPEP